MDERQDIIKDFLVESFDTLDRLDQEFVRLETEGGTPEGLNSIFRSVHTIKGTCGFLEFHVLEGLTHVGESLLDKLRAGKVAVSQPVISALLRLMDATRTMLRSIEASGNEGTVDFSDLKEELMALQESDAPPPNSVEDELEQILSQNQKNLWSADVASPPAICLTEVVDEDAGLKYRESSSEPSVAVFEPAPPSVPQPSAAPPSSQRATPAADEPKSGLAETSLRVDVELLDQLMNLVGELVLTRNQILQYTKQQIDATFLQTSQRLNLITSELQEGVMKTRMQPIGNVWSKFPRVVRDLSKQLSKKIKLEMEGQDTDLDKTIIEAIKDPLTHIVRNSVDHGIESPPERLAAGKPAEGTILLRAFHESGHVQIEIIDDGKGLNTERIRQKALEKGLVSPEKIQRMTEQDVNRLIFAPGFSTAEQVTNISGRGVGMDVVRSNIEKIGGSVDITSRYGLGATIRIKIPLTLAIIPALMVSSCGEDFAIPQVNLVELVRLDGEEIWNQIEEVGGSNFYRLRGNLLPLLYLSHELSMTPYDRSAVSTADLSLTIVVVRVDEKIFGIVVDTVHDTEEIVVKPLGKQLKDLPVYAGATILGDGRVALIIDVAGLGKRARVLGEVLEGNSRKVTRLIETNSDEEVGEHHALLVVQASEAHRVALPLDLVQRLEEIPASSIERAAGRPAVQYRGGILPLLDLEEYFGEPHTHPQGVLHVVVFSFEGGSVGCIVRRIVDIVDERIVVQRTQRRRGTVGAAIIQQQVTDLLDLTEVLRDTSIRPETNNRI